MRILLDLQGAQTNSRFRGIGRYSLALAQTIAQDPEDHEVWLALSGRFPDSIEPLRAAFARLIPPERIRVFEVPGHLAELEVANRWRMQAAELLREKFLADLRPDIVHVSSLFEGCGDDHVASVGRLDPDIKTAVTLYDLIPLLRPESYLADPNVKRWYLRRLQSLKRADLLLAISESSRREAIEALQISPERITTIGAGLSRLFMEGEASRETQVTIMSRYGLDRQFVLYTGGEDPRKNIEGLIAAFALLPGDMRRAYQLAIVCKLTPDMHTRLHTVAKKCGIDGGEIVCTDYVPDEDLCLLYAACSIFVFPSFHEGFGLPILEAMACGAPVIGSNCTSIPEIIDRGDALFDPQQPRDIARCMADVLSNAELRQSLKEWGFERVKTFTWQTAACKTLRAFEALNGQCDDSCAVHLRSRMRRRPLLAFVAPLPPKRSGIAGYSAKLLQSLARYYEIMCILDQPEVTDSWITAQFATRDVRWFEANAGKFERILYQFGNSEFHKHMFALLENHPGVVALHDFYLSGVLNWMANFRYGGPGSFTKALYDSHGFFALKKDRLHGRETSIAAFPCNLSVLESSIGVIVHSNHAIELARKWYGDGAPGRMRQVPFLPYPPEAAEREAARKRLGLPEDVFVVCCFGCVAPLKLNHRLLEAWLFSALAQDPACHLVFVGGNETGHYGNRLSERINGSSVASHIQITGYCEEQQYRDHLAAADLAVQLRTRSRGETSGAIFDCLSRKVPLVINAHGSAAELPDDVVMKLDDDFTDEALSAALERLRIDTSLRRNLADRGALHVSRIHHPERIAEMYRDVIEEFYDNSCRARELRLVQAVARISAPTRPTEADLAAVVTTLAANRDRLGLQQMLIDLTSLAELHARNYTESTVERIVMALIVDPPPGYRIEPIRAVPVGYRYARRFVCACLGLPADDLTDDPVEVRHRDIFIGIDPRSDTVQPLKNWFHEQRRRGTQTVFVAWDLLPLFKPEFVHPEKSSMALSWIRTVAEVADGVICTSKAAADDLVNWLAEAKPHRLQSLSIGFFPQASDLHDEPPTNPPPKGTADDSETIRPEAVV